MESLDESQRNVFARLASSEAPEVLGVLEEHAFSPWCLELAASTGRPDVIATAVAWHPDAAEQMLASAYNNNNDNIFKTVLEQVIQTDINIIETLDNVIRKPIETKYNKLREACATFAEDTRRAISDLESRVNFPYFYVSESSYSDYRYSSQLGDFVNGRDTQNKNNIKKAITAFANVLDRFTRSNVAT